MRETTANLISDWLIGYASGTRKGCTDIDQYTKWLQLKVDRDLIDAGRADIQRWVSSLSDHDVVDNEAAGDRNRA